MRHRRLNRGSGSPHEAATAVVTVHRLINAAARQHLAMLARVAGWRLVLCLALTVCLSLTEGIGLLLLLPLLQLVGLNTQAGAPGQITAFVWSILRVMRLPPTLPLLLGLYLLIMAARALLQRQRMLLATAIAQAFVRHLRERLYGALVRANWLFVVRNRSSDFVHTLTGELDRVEIGTAYLLSLITSVSVASVYLALAIKLSPVITAVVVLCALCLSFTLRRLLVRTYRVGEDASDAGAKLHSVIIEYLSMIKVVKSYGASELAVGDFSSTNAAMARSSIAAVASMASLKSWFDVGAALILSVFLYCSVRVLALPTASVLLLLFLFARLMPRVSEIQQSYQQYLGQLPAFRRVIEMQERCEAAAEPQPGRRETVPLSDSIRLEGVSFSYQVNGHAPVLHDLDLSIPAGKTIAIVGPSGGGKSTIADLVIGLLEPDQGLILVDGELLSSERRQAWRTEIGYVAQDPVLFHDSVRANLQWARPEASVAEVDEALRLAAAWDFVSRLPDGLGTVVGDRGVRLSGGERQRLALARALLRRPSLLILDEATSNLDSENELRVQQAIESLHGNLAILIISHRLSSIAYADYIYVIEEGRLVESGSWDELLAIPGGRFIELCRAQGIDTERWPTALVDRHAIRRSG